MKPKHLSDKMFAGTLSSDDVRVKIVGVGGAGNNTADRMQLDPESKIRLAAINTDVQSLETSPIQEKLMIGRSITRGLSAGGDAEVGRKAAEAECDAIGKIIQGMDIIFLCAGLGGGTGSGAAPVVAQIAAEQGALVIAFVTLPFTMEGARRQQQSEFSLNELRKVCHAVMPLPNELLIHDMSENATVLDAFAQADEWVNRGVKSICAMLFQTGLINLDFAMLKQVFANRGGKTLFGLGRGEGEGYVNKAIDDLAICPLLHTPEFARRADSLLVNIVGGTDLSIHEVNTVMTHVTEKFGSQANTVMGAVIDDSYQQFLEICVIGTTDMEGRNYVHTKQKVMRHEPAAAIPMNEEESSSDPNELVLTTASAKQKATRKRAHSSKLRKQEVVFDDQPEFLFIMEDEHRGYFERTDKNMFAGEDLDVPTYMRKKIKLHL